MNTSRVKAFQDEGGGPATPTGAAPKPNRPGELQNCVSTLVATRTRLRADAGAVTAPNSRGLLDDVIVISKSSVAGTYREGEVRRYGQH